MLRRSEASSDAVTECFADDAMIYSTGTTALQAVTLLNSALKDTAEWIAQSDLVLNDKKCVYMFVTPPGKKDHIADCSAIVQMGDHELERKWSVKYLGVHVDQHLQWSQHFKHVKSKINNGICLINRAELGLPKEHRVALYRAFVEPHIDLCAPVWSSAAEKYINNVEVAQRKVMRALADYDPTQTTDQIFKDWGIQKARERWMRLDAQWLYKLRHPLEFPAVPDYIRALVPFRETGRQTRTNSKVTNIVPPVCRTKIGERMFCHRLRQLDLKFPHEIWNSSSLYTFRHAFSLIVDS